MSLRRRLLFTLLGAVLLAGVIASAATYYSARTEVQTLLDEELRQVALSLRDHAVLDLGGLASAAQDSSVVIQVRNPYGSLTYLTNTRTPLPLAASPGFSTIYHDGREWRMFTVFAGGQTIQAAQTTSERDERAAAAALRVLFPVLGALPLLGLLVWLILERGLAPLARVANAVGSRDASALEPLPPLRTPEEIEPLIGALNNLLARLRKAFDLQRRFAADAAHELRTPLTALGLQIQLLERARTDEERAAGLIGLRERAKRAERIVQQLLAMARLEPEAAQRPAARVALDTLARSVVDELAPLAAQKPIMLGLGRVEPASITGDEDSLRLLATNLVDNAIRYTGRGGRVEVSAWREGTSCMLQVCDDGPGIAPGDRRRVFDRFYRGPARDTAGSGLGLAIVRQVAALHEARVELADGLGGRGLCARFISRAAP